MLLIMKPAASTRRYFLEKATGFAFCAATLRSFGSAFCLTEPGEAARHQRSFVHGDIWFMNIELDHPKLVPPVVQFAVMDKDPAPGFRARANLLRQRFQKQLAEVTIAEHRAQRRSAQLIGLWNYGFRDVSGDQVGLLASDAPCQVCSNGSGGKRWIVTKGVEVEGRVVCWCLAVEVWPGKTIELSLTNKNTFDLSSG